MWFKRTPQKSKLTILMERIIFELGQGLVEQFFFEWIGKKGSRKISFGFFFRFVHYLVRFFWVLKTRWGQGYQKFNENVVFRPDFDFRSHQTLNEPKSKTVRKTIFSLDFWNFLTANFCHSGKWHCVGRKIKKIYFEIRIFAWVDHMIWTISLWFRFIRFNCSY